ncbi:MAG: glycosyltransferase family 4 protein [Euryarchaeota archaeon]|nr:glycosyltransferase family 4 protein [Euryarchaeota archaeon]
MKVLLLTPWKPARGGIVTHVENLMARSENDFEIISYPSWARAPFIRALVFLAAGFLSGVMKDFDLIHAHYAVPQGLLGVILGKVKKKPVVLTLHGSDVLVLGRRRALRPILRWVFSRCRRLIAVSRYLKEEAVGIGADGSKIEVIYGGVEVPAEESGTASGGGGYTVTFVGALVRQKGADVLLEAFREVRARVPDARLQVVGDGPERARLEGMEVEGVEFLGYVDSVDEVYQGTDLLVQPSREEGFGLVILEAMARGIPVVASRVGGIPEVVGPDYGGLVPAGDPASLAEAVVRVLQDPGLRESLARKGRERAREFSWEKMAKEVNSVYEEAVGRTPSQA